MRDSLPEWRATGAWQAPGRAKRRKASPLNPDAIHVVAGVLRDERDRVLVAQRARGKHLAGLWEFPGGKLDPGEDPHAALRRELHEELGIEARTFERLIRVPWRYPDKTIVLDAYRVPAYDGVPRGRENQALAWQRVDEMSMLEMPPPDRPIVNALRLPDRYAITPEPGIDDSDLLARVERVLVGGVRLLRLRMTKVDAARRRALACATRELAHGHGAFLLVDGDVELARASGADGVHLSTAELMQAPRRPLSVGDWVAASCHSVAEIEKANALGVDFGVVGAVLPTPSHVGAAALGWQRFADLCSLAAFPVFALGGMRDVYLATARAAGAQGIAGISSFFGDG